MKKSNSENTFEMSPFDAKPPLSNIGSKSLKMGYTSVSRGSLPTSPTSAQESSPFRSTSSSPRRHMSPDSKLKIVSAGNSFCLVKEEVSPSPSDDIRSGRKSPFISSRAWPKALRTRSASKERISSKQGILQSSIGQMKAFQESKIHESYFMSRSKGSEDEMSCDKTNLSKSTSIACLPRMSPGNDALSQKGILKATSSQQVFKVNDRIKVLQKNIDETHKKPLSTLPWNSKLCSPEAKESQLRKTASSPCLFVKKSSVKIKTGKAPIKLYSTLTNVSNMLEEKLSRIASKEVHASESNENQDYVPRERGCRGKSHEPSDTTYVDDASQDSSCPFYNSIPFREKTQNQGSMSKGEGIKPNDPGKSMRSAYCIQNEQLKFNEITLQEKRIPREDICQQGSADTNSRDREFSQTDAPCVPHKTGENKDLLENVSISGNSILTESEFEDRPENSTLVLSKQIELPSGWCATSRGTSNTATCNKPTQSAACDRFFINNQGSSDLRHKKDELVTGFLGGGTEEGDRNADRVVQLNKDVKSHVLGDTRENNEKPLVLSMEHVNSSEDEEIQKELSSILTNDLRNMKSPNFQPRTYNNPFMKDVIQNRENLKNSTNIANIVEAVSDFKNGQVSDAIDTNENKLNDSQSKLDFKFSENAQKSSYNLTSELEASIPKISINPLPRPIIAQESAKLISLEEQERPRCVDAKGNEMKEYTKSAPRITHLGNSGVGVHNMYGVVPSLPSSQLRTEGEAVKSDLFRSTCEIRIKPRVSFKEREEELTNENKKEYIVRRFDLEQSDLSESSSRQDESSPPRDSPSPESSSSDTEVSDDELSRIRRRNHNNRRGSMPEREIDEEDTETAELQVNLRKISGRSFIPSVKLKSIEKDENDNIPDINAPKEEDSKQGELGSKEVEDSNSLDDEFVRHRRSQRRGSMPEREISEDDTETAEFQTNLRKLSAKSQEVTPGSITESKSSPELVDEISPEEEASDDFEGSKENQIDPEAEATKVKTTKSMDPPEENKQIFRPAIPARGRTPGGLRRSRTWQGFGSGLRYESVSDAGLPPPPATPNGGKSGEGVSRSQLPCARQSLPRSYRPLSNLRRNPESGPKSWRRPTGTAFPSTTPVVGHSTVRSQGEQGGIARSLSEGNVLQEWEESDEEVEYECSVTCSVRRPHQNNEMSVEDLQSEVECDNTKMIDIPGETADKSDSEENGREDLSPAQIQQLMSVIAGMESIKKASGHEGNSENGSGSPPPTDEEIQQFIEYVGMGVINNDRIEYEERRRKGQEEETQPEPPKRNKQASQYFWRRHYLSIIQEDDEEHNEQTPGSSRSVSRANSRPGSTYENNFNRLSRVLGAMSPLAIEQRVPLETTDKVDGVKDMRASWGSEMSVDSLTSVNSILSEEGSITSNSSFISDSLPTDPHPSALASEKSADIGQKRASQSLSCLLDSVHPPSNTPDSMMSCESPTVRLSKSEVENDDSVQVIKFKMGSKFKQSIQEIEESKRKGKREFKECVEHSLSVVGQCTPAQVVKFVGINPSPYQAQVSLTSSDPPQKQTALIKDCASNPYSEMETSSVKEETTVLEEEEMHVIEETKPKGGIQELMEDHLSPQPEEIQKVLQEESPARPFKAIPSARLRKPRGGRRSWEI